MKLAQIQAEAERVYSAGKRVRLGALAKLIELGLFFGPLLAVLVLAGRQLPLLNHDVDPVLIAVTILGGPAAVLVFGPFFPLLGNAALRRDLQARIASGVWAPVHASDAVEVSRRGEFVGISPGAELWFYEGSVDWDVGFLLAEPGYLRYYGDRTCFGLQPAQVTGLEVRSEDRHARLLLSWRDDASGREGIINLGVRDLRSHWQAPWQTERLKKRLDAWKQDQLAEGAAGFLPLPSVFPQE
jgi:hypothetical protein